MAFITFRTISIVDAPCEDCNGSITIEYSGPFTPTPTYPVEIIVYRTSDFFFVYDEIFTNSGPYTFNNLCPDEYVITAGQSTPTGQVITDPDNLITLVVSPGTIITLSTNTTDCSTFGGSNGTVTASILESYPNMEYKVNAGSYQSSPVFTGLSAGTYSLTAREIDSGCTKITEFTINQPVSPTGLTGVSISLVQPISCSGLCNGALLATPSGSPIGTLTYSWTFNAAPSGVTTINFPNACAGTYTVTVTDSAGPDFTSSPYILTAPAALNSTFSSTNITCLGGHNGTISLTSTVNGTSPYFYSWSGPQGFSSTSPNLTGLYAGTYICTTTDSSRTGCTTSDTVVITQATEIVSHFVIQNAICFADTDGSITLTPTGGTGPYTYNWHGTSPLNTTRIYDGLQPGTYTVTITDSAGCTIEETFIITSPDQIVVQGTVTGVTTESTNTGIIITSITGGISPYTYHWNTGETTKDLYNLRAGVYTITVLDAEGCSVQKSFEILLECNNLSFSEFKVFSMKLQCCLGNKIKTHNRLVRAGRQDLADKELSNLMFLRILLDRFLCIESLTTDGCWNCDNIEDLMNIAKKLCECDCCEEELEGKVNVHWNPDTNLFDIIN